MHGPSHDLREKKLETLPYLRSAARSERLLNPSHNQTGTSISQKMTTRKHNEFLDVPSDEEEADVGGYSSEENDTKSKGRAVKKRRTETQDFFGLESDEDLSPDDEEEETKEESRVSVQGKSRKQTKTKRQGASTRDEESEEDDADADEDEEDNDRDDGDERDGHADDNTKSTEGKKSQKVLSTKLLKKPKKDKSGVVYLSSLPPYLKPYVPVSPQYSVASAVAQQSRTRGDVQFQDQSSQC